MEGTTPLDMESDEYQQVRHLLLACLVGKGEVGRVDISKIENQQLSMRYERKSKGLLKMSCLTNVTLDKLSAENKDVARVCREGFDFRRDGGMEFATGVLSSVKPSSPSSLAPEEYTIIVSEVAVGRSLIAEDKNVATLALPPEYNSFYVPPKPLDRNGDGVFDYEEFQLAASFDGREPVEYQHRYYVKDAGQVLPKYTVQFSFAHRAVPLPPAPQHEYFDPVLYRPLTLAEYRKTTGRQLQTLDEAYAQAKKDYEKPDALVKGRRDWIEQQLGELERREQLINLNFGHVQEELDETRDRCQTELRALSRSKYEALLAVEVELHRQKEQIAWMDVVMKKTLQATEAKLKARGGSAADAQVEFLRSWKCHTVFRNSMMRLKAAEMNVLQRVVPDMALRGGRELKVWLDPHAMSRGDGAGGGDAAAGGAGKDQQQSDLWRSLQSASSQGHYLVPPRPQHDLLVPTLQSIVDFESERIQHCLEVAKKDGAIALPPSVTRSPLAGDRYPAPLAGLLTALDPAGLQTQQPGGEPRQRFAGAISTFAGKINEKMAPQNLAGPWFSPTDAAGIDSYGQPFAGDAYDDDYDYDDAAAAEEALPPPPTPTAAGADPQLPKRSGVATPFNPKAGAPEAAGSPSDPSLRLSIPVLEKIAQRFPACAMARQVQSKKSKLANNRAAQAQFSAGAESLGASEILHEYGPDEAVENIYYALPSSSKPPVLSLLFSSAEHDGGLSTLIDRCVLVRPVHNHPLFLILPAPPRTSSIIHRLPFDLPLFVSLCRAPSPPWCSSSRAPTPLEPTSATPSSTRAAGAAARPASSSAPRSGSRCPTKPACCQNP